MVRQYRTNQILGISLTIVVFGTNNAVTDIIFDVIEVGGVQCASNLTISCVIVSSQDGGLPFFSLMCGFNICYHWLVQSDRKISKLLSNLPNLFPCVLQFLFQYRNNTDLVVNLFF